MLAMRPSQQMEAGSWMRQRLVAVAAATLFPVVAMLGYNEYASRLQRNEEVRAQAAQAARQASSEVERILEGLHSLLIATSALDGVEAKDRLACIEDLKRVALQVPSIRTVLVLDTDGKLVCDSLGSQAGLDFSDRSYFSWRLSLTTTSSAVSRKADFLISPSCPSQWHSGKMEQLLVSSSLDYD